LSSASFRPSVLSAKGRLARGLEDLKQRHAAGCSGLELCTLNSDLRDAALLELLESALADLGEGGLMAHAALVAHGGYGRRDVAPYSDVDLMLLHEPAVGDRVSPLADRLLRDVFDAGLILGHSVRTVEQACKLALGDPMICTSLMESRLLVGDEKLFEQFQRCFLREVRKRYRALAAEFTRERSEERIRYGETVFLLEPNIKRSRGTLRDLQLVRWLGFARWGTASLEELEAAGAISAEDRSALERASEFLLRLRNDLHFHAGQAADVLSRAEQLRIADARAYPAAPGLLPVEQFMRDYFRHTNGISHIATRLEAKVLAHERLMRFVTDLFGHRVEPGVRVGPAGLVVARHGLQKFHGNLAAILRLVDLANLYDLPIAPATWEAISSSSRTVFPGRQVSPGRQPGDGTHDEPQSSPGSSPGSRPGLAGEICRSPIAALTPEACRHFLSLLDHPARLGSLLRDLHEAAILERLIPQFATARGLLQFNQYHKYTVDEHCIRAVECATEFWSDTGPLGQVYRGLPQKRLLHLALLLHDLGKGHLEDHREVGARIAAETGPRLGLNARETEIVRLLVQKHLLMNHLAFRRDMGDEQTVVRFAVQVGSPEVLEMLFVLTAADLAAVGPGVWDGWKAEILGSLYQRTMQHLAVDAPSIAAEELLARRREDVCSCLGESRTQPWFARQIDALPAGYLSTTAPEQVAADLRLLSGLGPREATAAAQYRPDTQTVQFTVGTSEEVTPGIFHKLTGALSSHGLQIRSAQINTLANGLVLDRFWVHDPDFAGEPPRDRLEDINRALVAALHAPGAEPPAFRRRWQVGSHGDAPKSPLQTRVNVDNNTSDRYTILDVFTHDRTGLLYAITRALFELDLSVWRAKIGTYLDQVVDVFYVSDRQDRKIQDERQIEDIRGRLLEVIEKKDETQL